MDDAALRRKFSELEARIARAEGSMHYWSNGEPLARSIIGASGLLVQNTMMIVVPVFPPGKMHLQVARVAAGLPGAGSATARMGLYSVRQPTLINRDRTPRVSNLDLALIDKFDITYSFAGNPETAITSTTQWHRVEGSLERTRQLAPEVQYAIGVRVTSAVVFATAADARIVESPIVSGLSASDLSLPAEATARSGQSSFVALSLLSPRAAAILR